MGVNIGDKVRYLNEVGGGVVTRFQNKNVVVVLQDDGFEVPVLIKECVVIESVHVAEKSSTPQKTADSNSEEVYLYEETDGGDVLNLIFALVPQDAKNIPGVALDTYIINDSNYFVSYVIAESQKNKLYPIGNGIIEPNTKVACDSYSMTQLDEMDGFFIQVIAFKKDKPYQKQDVLQKDIRINAVKLSKANSYGRNDYFHEPAIIYKVNQDELELKMEQLTKEQTLGVIAEKERRPRIKQHQTPNPKTSILEIDLHIHQLLDDTVGMSNGEMLQYQMDTFNKVMAENKTNKGQKIVFIHGIGNGTLKTDLRKEIERVYKCPYQDASFREYGFGATMVIIK